MAARHPTTKRVNRLREAYTVKIISNVLSKSTPDVSKNQGKEQNPKFEGVGDISNITATATEDDHHEKRDEIFNVMSVKLRRPDLEENDLNERVWKKERSRGSTSGPHVAVDVEDSENQSSRRRSFEQCEVLHSSGGPTEHGMSTARPACQEDLPHHTDQPLDDQESCKQDTRHSNDKISSDQKQCLLGDRYTSMESPRLLDDQDSNTQNVCPLNGRDSTTEDSFQMSDNDSSMPGPCLIGNQESTTQGIRPLGDQDSLRHNTGGLDDQDSSTEGTCPSTGQESSAQDTCPLGDRDSPMGGPLTEDSRLYVGLDSSIQDSHLSLYEDSLTQNRRILVARDPFTQNCYSLNGLDLLTKDTHFFQCLDSPAVYFEHEFPAKYTSENLCFDKSPVFHQDLRRKRTRGSARRSKKRKAKVNPYRNLTTNRSSDDAYGREHEADCACFAVRVACSESESIDSKTPFFETDLSLSHSSLHLSKFSLSEQLLHGTVPTPGTVVQNVLPGDDKHTHGLVDSSGKAIMRSEHWRLKSFAKMESLPVSAQRLAQNGFYYDENLDDIVCYSCQLKKRRWDRTERIAVVHLLLSPHCEHANFCDERNIGETPYVSLPGPTGGAGVCYSGGDGSDSEEEWFHAKESPSAPVGGCEAVGNHIQPPVVDPRPADTGSSGGNLAKCLEPLTEKSVPTDTLSSPDMADSEKKDASSVDGHISTKEPQQSTHTDERLASQDSSSVFTVVADGDTEAAPPKSSLAVSGGDGNSALNNTVDASPCSSESNTVSPRDGLGDMEPLGIDSRSSANGGKVNEVKKSPAPKSSQVIEGDHGDSETSDTRTSAFERKCTASRGLEESSSSDRRPTTQNGGTQITAETGEKVKDGTGHAGYSTGNTTEPIAETGSLITGEAGDGVHTNTPVSAPDSSQSVTGGAGDSASNSMAYAAEKISYSQQSARTGYGASTASSPPRHNNHQTETWQPNQARETALSRPSDQQVQWVSPQSEASLSLSLPPPSGRQEEVERHQRLVAKDVGSAMPDNSLAPLFSFDQFNPSQHLINGKVYYTTTTETQVPSVTTLPTAAVLLRYPVPVQQAPCGTPNQNFVPLQSEQGRLQTDGASTQDEGSALVLLDMTRAASRANASVRARLASFTGWPARGVPRPRALVIAGFYYLGKCPFQSVLPS